MRGTAAHVVPARGPAHVGHLAGAEFLEVIGRCHAAGVEEILVLPDPPRPRLGRLALWRDAINRDLGLIDRDRPEVADLRAELVHQIDIWVEAEVARALHHPVGARLAEAR